MTLLQVLLALPLLVAVTSFPAMTWVVLQRREPGRRPFTGLALLVAGWGLAVLASWSGGDVLQPLLWGRLELSLSALVPPLGLMVALRMTGRRALPAWILLAAGWVAAALPWSAATEAWVWRSLAPSVGTALGGLAIVPGPVFWLWWAAAALGMTLAAIAVLALHARRPRRSERAGMALLALAPLPPMVLAFFAVLVVPGDPVLELVPVGLGLSGLLLAWGLERRWAVLRGPVEYRDVFNGLGDGLVLVDEGGVVLDMNPAAEGALGMGAQTAFGRPLASIRKDFAVMGRESVDLPPSDGTVFEARSHPLPGGGRLLIVHDVTARRTAAEALRRRAELLAASEAVSRDFLEHPDWAAAVDGMLARLGRAIEADRAALIEIDRPQPGQRPDRPRPPAAPRVRRWETDRAAPWPDGRPPYGSQLLERAATPPGFSGGAEETPPRDRDVLAGLGIGYLALLPVAAGDERERLLAFEWGPSPPAWLPLVADTLRVAPAALEAAVRRREGELVRDRARRYQATLLEATRELLAQEVTPGFYQALLARAVAVIPGAQAGCVLLRGADDRFTLVAGTGPDTALLTGARFTERELQPAPPARVDDRPRLLRGDALDHGVEGARARAAREAGSGPGPAVSLAVPVVLQGRLEAALRLDNVDSEDGFAPEALDLAEAFGLQMAALLQRLRLEQRRERAARMNALLADIERLLLAGGELSDVFPVLARLALEVPGLGFDRMAVLRLETPTVTLDAYDAAGNHDEALEKALLDAGWTDSRRGPLFAGEPGDAPRFREEAGEGQPVGAFAAQPLMLHGRRWGMIVFCSLEPRTFDGQVRDTLGQLAGSIELALVRQRDLEQRAWQLAKLEALVHVSEALRGATRRRDVVLRSLQTALDMTRAQLCNLFLLDSGSGTLRLVGSRAQAGAEPYPVGAMELARGGDGAAWSVVESGLTVRLSEEGELATVDVPAGRRAPSDYMATPLRNGQGRVVGVISALLHAPGRRFEREDAGFLEAISQACGNALDRLALLEQSRGQAEEYRALFESAQRQASELTLLDRVRATVASELDVDAVFEAAAAATVEAFGYRGVGLFARAGDELALRYRRGSGDAERFAALAAEVVASGQASAAPAGGTRAAAETGEAAPGEAAPGNAAPGQAVAAQGDGSAAGPWRAAVPLAAGDGIVGALVVEGNVPESVEREVALLEAVGEQLGVAVERGRLYGAVRRSEQRFRLLAEHMHDLVCLHGRDGRFAYVSPSAATVLGYDPDDLVGSDPFALVHPEDRQRLREAAEQRLLEGAETVQVEYRLQHADGHTVWLETLARPVRGDDGTLVNVVTSSRDITERKRMEERLVQGALFDELTGLPNRALLLDRLRQALSRAERHDGWRFALLFLDLDRFKVVNDSLGHNAGDELLRALGTRLKACVRGSDTVARLGGDEFCVLIEDVDGPERATASATRIQSALAEPFTLHGHDLVTSASIGIAFSAPHYREPSELLRDADIAMYRAKASGKARFAVFDEAMHVRALDQMQLETRLHGAVERGELFLEYQPVVRLEGGELAGVEALVRWRVPQQGLVPPSEFVPLAEESGQIVAIDRWVLGEATRQLASWGRELGEVEAPLVVSVNVSARHLAMQEVDGMLAAMLREAGVPAERLKLEIAEGALMSYPEAAVETLERLHDLGVRVQMDDFGTGFSSMKHLQRLPIDSLKVDRSFVRGIDGDPANRAVVAAMVGLAANLGLEVVAEGIEREEELRTLLELGCTFGQGYLFDPPLSAADIGRRLQARRTV